MQLVILAAGRGVRLGWHSHNIPKSLVTIQDQPYLAYQLRAFDRFPWSQKFIVGGFGISFLRDFFRNYTNMNYEVLENIDFLKGNLYTLKTAQAVLTESFFVFNADHYYSLENYKKIFATPPHKITIFCDRDRTLTDDDMKVKTKAVKADVAHLVTMSKTLADYDFGYVGVTYIPQNSMAKYWAAVTATATELGDKANVEQVLNTLANQGEAIEIRDISGSWWTEIDTPEDLQNARDVILKNQKSTS